MKEFDVDAVLAVPTEDIVPAPDTTSVVVEPELPKRKRGRPFGTFKKVQKEPSEIPEIDISLSQAIMPKPIRIRWKATKAGRKYKYKKKYCAMLIKHCAQGNSIESFSAIIFTPISIIESWKKEHPEFNEAAQIGHSLALAWWESLGVLNAGTKAINAQMYISTMKNRFGWVEKDNPVDSPPLDKNNEIRFRVIHSREENEQYERDKVKSEASPVS